MGNEDFWVVLLSALIFLSFALIVALFWFGWKSLSVPTLSAPIPEFLSDG